MKLCYTRINGGNFGDDLNPWLWGRLIPDLLDDDEGAGFYGIGTLLHRELPRRQIKIIFGAGAGYRRPPAVDRTWRIYFVRGPLTASALRIDAAFAVTDPAYLLRACALPEEAQEHACSFMPHHGSRGLTDWPLLCRLSGCRYIDPAGPVEAVIREIRRSRILITEALHGAVAADAFRVPWIPVRVSHRILDFKWRDWCRSVALPYRPIDLPVVFEGDLPWPVRLRAALKRGTRALGLGKEKWKRLPLRRSSGAEKERVIECLARIPRKADTFLSSEDLSRTVTRRLLDKLEQLKKDHARGIFPSPAS